MSWPSKICLGKSPYKQTHRLIYCKTSLSSSRTVAKTTLLGTLHPQNCIIVHFNFVLFWNHCIVVPAPPEVEEELDTEPPEAAAAAAAQPLEPQAVEVDVEAAAAGPVAAGG